MTTLNETRRALVISLDGLDARYLERRDEFGLRIPTLRRLMKEGATSRSLAPIYPSVTYPVHTTIATGAHPARHGIFGNELFERPEMLQSGDWHWFARDICADALWDAAHRQGLAVGIVSWPVAAGAGDWNVPEMLKPGITEQDALTLISKHARPQGFMQEVERNDGALYSRVTRDEHDDLRTRVAEYMLTQKRPHLMLVHLFDFDHCQHEHGPFTPEAFAMLERLDAYVARLIAALKRAGTFSETTIFLVSDHGFAPISKLVHPGILLMQHGLLEAVQENDGQGRTRVIVKAWRAVPYITGCSCAIMLRDSNDRKVLEKLRALFASFAEREESGIKRVIEREEIRALGANPRAALMLDAARGFAFGCNIEGEVITPSRQRGQHGHLPAHYNASFIATGKGFRRGADLGTIRMIDLGPTIARTLGFSLRDAEGESLNQI